MKCPKCNGTGIDDDRLICYECDGTGEYEPFDADVELDKLDDDIKPKLKPCPFCGGKAILYIDCGYYIAECEDCEAMSGEHETADETIEAWNKRVSEVTE